MSVYVYRLTTKTVKTSDGRVAHVMECMGPGPHYRASDRAQAAWDRKIRTGQTRKEKIGALSGLYVEDDTHGADVYEGLHAVYFDSHDYVVAKDETGTPLTVNNPRKARSNG